MTSAVLVPVRARIEAARSEKGESFRRRENVVEIILDDLRRRAEFLSDGSRCYLHYQLEHDVVWLGRDCRLLQVKLREDYGLLPNEVLFREVVEALDLWAVAHGRRVKLHPFSHFNTETGTLYVSNLGRYMTVIPPHGLPAVQPNGFDGVLFIADERWEGLPPTRSNGEIPKVALGDPGFPLTALLEGIEFVDDVLSSHEQKLLFLIWGLSLYFPELFPTKPLLTLLGPAGSGKTFALRRLGLMLLGSSFNVTPLASSAKDFDAAITNDPLVVFDNLDRRSAPWLPDRLATAATGASLKVRALYKDNVQLVLPIIAALAMTSRTPDDLRREDIADRCLVLKLARHDAKAPEHELLRQALERRPAFLEKVTVYLDLVVKALASQRERYRGPFRMADFADFALAVGTVLGMSPDQMRDILDRLARVQRGLAVEDDPIVELLDVWTAIDGNLGRPVLARELVTELQHLVPAGQKLPEDLRDAVALGKKLQASANTLENRYGLVQGAAGGGVKRYSFNRMG